jgi:hypothetical protein
MEASVRVGRSWTMLLIVLLALGDFAVGRGQESTTSLTKRWPMPVVQSPAIRVEIASSDAARAVVMERGAESFVIEAEAITVSTTKGGFKVSATGMATLSLPGRPSQLRVQDLELSVPRQGQVSFSGKQVTLR